MRGMDYNTGYATFLQRLQQKGGGRERERKGRRSGEMGVEEIGRKEGEKERGREKQKKNRMERESE